MNKLKYEIPLNENQKFILNTLQSKGQGYIVGGFIRDYLLGIENNDCDFATNLSLEEMQELFKDFKQEIVGKHFQILLVKIDGVSYEIARFRMDLKCSIDNRKDVEVAFTNDLEEDLKRRDFTINAMAYDGTNLYWLGNSFQDAKYGILEFVGDAEERIKEDALRILRAIRFIQSHNLIVSEEFINIINKNKKLILNLSSERIRDEIKKILKYEIKNSAKAFFLFEKVQDCYLPKDRDWKVNMAYMLRNYRYSIDTVEHILKEFKFSNADIKDIVLLYKCILLNHCFDNQIFRYLISYNATYLYDLLGYSKTKIENIPKNFKELNITSKQIMDLGIPQDKINKVQNLLLDEVSSLPKLNNYNDLCILIQGMDFKEHTLTEKINDYLSDLYIDN